MTEALSLYVRKTVRQDVALLVAILQICKEHPGLSPAAMSLSLTARGCSYDGKPLPKDNATAEDRVRLKKFNMTFDQILEAALTMRLCLVRQRLIVESVMSPTNFPFLYLTRAGVLFLQLPLWLKCTVWYLIDRMSSVVFWAKKYRWIGTAIGLVSGALKFAHSHDFSESLIFFTVAVGIGSAAILGLIGAWFGSDHQPFRDDDLA